VIQAASRQSGARAGEGRLSIVLIVLQLAVSLTLVVTAGLLVRSFERLAAAPLGFERDRAIVVTVASPTVPAADRHAFYRRLVAAVRDVPGVGGAGGSMNPPIAGMLIGNFVVSEPGVAPPPDAEQFSQSDSITAGFVGAYGMKLQAGRDFDDHDAAGGDPVMIVNEAFVRRFVRGGNAVGRAVDLTYRMPSQGDYLLGTKTIVGVVSDAVYRSLRDLRRPTVYLPFAQQTGPILHSNFYVAVRATAGSPALLSRQVSEAMLALNHDLTLTVRPISEEVDAALAQDRLVAWLAAFFGALAVVLAALGLYGLTAYSVARRRPEIGIRMALGATAGGIVRIILGRVVVVVLLGTAVGVGGAFAATKVVGSLLYGIEAHDPMTFVVTALVLAVVSGMAAYVPARHASRVDPAEVLRRS
jgi:predicted permease